MARKEEAAGARGRRSRPATLQRSVECRRTCSVDYVAVFCPTAVSTSWWLRPSAGSRRRLINPLRINAPIASLTVGSDTLSSRANAVLRAAGGGPTSIQLSTTHLGARHVMRLGRASRQDMQPVTDSVQCGNDLRVETAMTFPIGLQRKTSLSLPVETSKTKPRNDSCLVTNGFCSIRRSD